MKNADQPIYPQTREEAAGIASYMGLAKREYFAAHAPEVPEWFKPEIPARFTYKSPPKVDEYEHHWSKEAKEWAMHICGGRYINVNHFCDMRKGNGPDSTIDQFIVAASDWWKANLKRELEYNTYLFRAWRYYYADMMLAEEGDKEGNSAGE